MTNTKFKVISLDELSCEETSHGNSVKQVFLRSAELFNQLTQIAFSRFLPDEQTPMHSHQSMDEYFFFLSGQGRYIIAEETIVLQPKMLIEIPAGTNHQLIADKPDGLEFLYWGVAIER